MSENTLCTFTCGECGRDGFTVVDRNPPIPMEVVSIYDKDNEGEDCHACPTCGTEFPQFKLYHPPTPRWPSAQPHVWTDGRKPPRTLHDCARIMLAQDDRPLKPGEVRRGYETG